MSGPSRQDPQETRRPLPKLPVIRLVRKHAKRQVPASLHPNEGADLGEACRLHELLEQTVTQE